MDMEKVCMEILGITNAELVAELKQICKIRTLSKGELFIQIGESQPEAAILLSGILRGFYVDSNGNDITDYFSYEIGDCVAYCFSASDISRINVKALTECTLLCLPFEDLDRLKTQYYEISSFFCSTLSKLMFRHWDDKIAITQFSATERYDWFLNKYPGIIDKVKKKYVASFLNLTPQTLSLQRKLYKESFPKES